MQLRSRPPKSKPGGSARLEDSPLELKPAEVTLRIVLQVLAFLYGIASVSYALLGLNDIGAFQPLVAAALCTKTALLATLCFFVAGNVRRARPPIVAMTIAHVVTIAITVVFIAKQPSALVASSVLNPNDIQLLAFSSFLDLIVVVVTNWLLLRAERARFSFLGFLSPMQYQTLSALADVLILDRRFGAAEPIRPDEVAFNIDKLLRLFKGNQVSPLRGAVYVLAFAPILRLKSDFAYMNSADRLEYLTYLVKEFVETDLSGNSAKRNALKMWWRRLPPVAFINRLVRTALVAARQLVYIGYYSDPAVQASIGFQTFTERTTFDPTELDRVKPPGLDVEQSGALRTPLAADDIVIIGSGAGASILANELVRQGFNVLMIERGMHVAPETFTQDEAGMVARLYADGIMQYSRNMALQVVQGSCIGGSTVVNNGICFDPPEDVVKVGWVEHGAQIDYARLMQSTVAVRALLKVDLQPDAFRKTPILNPSGAQFIDGLRVEGLEATIVEANITDCLGCGYCNIGCRYGRKLSMLNHVLPLAQHLHKSDQQRYGRLRILSECEAIRISTTSLPDGQRKAVNVQCHTGSGSTIEISGKAFVVAAGAVASSTLLMRSGLGGPAVGTHLSFNIACVMTGRFRRPIKAYAGLQMSHYYLAGIEDANGVRNGYALETWFNPPMTQSVSMPGWFETHFGHMQNYKNMMSIGVLVGTSNESRVLPPNYSSWASTLKQVVTRRTDPGFDPVPFRLGDVVFNAAVGSSIVFKPSEEDIKRMTDGLIHAGRVMLQANAEFVMPSTVAYHTFTSCDELTKLRSIVRAAPELQALQLGSAHPQGGNPLSDDPKRGVVDSRFRVHGTHNVFVCDASVFPTSVGLNPQLTVMALAHYAAEPISHILRHELGS